MLYTAQTQTLENTVMDQEMKHPMTTTEEERCKTGTPRKTIVEERLCNKRPDGQDFKMFTLEKLGEFDILEFKRIPDVTDQYVTRAKRVSVPQYVSIKAVLERTMGHQGLLMSQRNFIGGARSLNEQDLHYKHLERYVQYEIQWMSQRQGSDGLRPK